MGSFYDFDRKTLSNKYSVELNVGVAIYPIVFDEKIEDFAELKKIIEFYADKFGFECNFPPEKPVARELII
ncbi:hypothetical protein GCM10011611_52390 [Aliidongia dinghuensis]|uniref:Uncharacterized protein n=2 Tax=Aliidongia dinghuensis TaxID=1867774 RepID=A0A8J2YZ80_9PROT|nr:hypothetical protein GCM10011611_52390 [Aliidongia dinghuensis]